MFLIPLLQADLVNRTFLLGTIRTLSFGGDTAAYNVCTRLSPPALYHRVAAFCTVIIA
jgi:hypothetical protein